MLATAMTLAAVASAMRHRTIVDTLDAVGVPAPMQNLLTAALQTGAVGLVIGIFIPAVGFAAAVCTSVYFIGAACAHLRIGRHDIGAATILLLRSVSVRRPGRGLVDRRRGVRWTMGS
ncbi:DoxX family protein [Nocardia sp. NBC_00565]|uniref:DoxX family protein n=1 Tax=Nocardia sp. NBC_00565 TaxID=2975993 RepID=UPI003FA5EE63